VSPLFLLDTNILSAAIRSPEDVLGQRIAAVGRQVIVTSMIVAAELRFGIAKKGATALAARVEAALQLIAVLPFDEAAARAYGPMRAELERTGSIISANDMLIGAHALALNAVLVTDNEREFRRVPGLAVENWL
jgi:tRNA(fMet)-specific endonuclease VapC